MVNSRSSLSVHRCFLNGQRQDHSSKSAGCLFISIVEVPVSQSFARRGCIFLKNGKPKKMKDTRFLMVAPTFLLGKSKRLENKTVSVYYFVRNRWDLKIVEHKFNLRKPVRLICATLTPTPDHSFPQLTALPQKLNQVKIVSLIFIPALVITQGRIGSRWRQIMLKL